MRTSISQNITARLFVTMLFFPAVASASMTSLPAATPFSWGNFGSGLVISSITAQQYVNLDGSANGSVIPFSSSVYFQNGPTLQQIGNVGFQYVPWKGSTLGVSGSTNRFGAAIFGGFNLTALDAGSNFSFLQIYTDSANPNGVIDGGGYFGKFNSLIPRYGQTPGWDYAGAQYDYFDVPFDLLGDVSESVSFETALVSYDVSTVKILGDYTWSFTTGAGGNPQTFLTGTSITSNSLASSTLLNLYSLANPGITYVQIVPEPSCLAVIGLVLIAIKRPRKRAAA